MAWGSGSIQCFFISKSTHPDIFTFDYRLCPRARGHQPCCIVITVVILNLFLSLEHSPLLIATVPVVVTFHGCLTFSWEPHHILPFLLDIWVFSEFSLLK